MKPLNIGDMKYCEGFFSKKEKDTEMISVLIIFYNEKILMTK